MKIPILLVLVLLGGGCSSTRNTSGDVSKSNPKLNFTLNNSTGTALRGLYVSPSSSAGWEENLITTGKLNDGDKINIKFNPDEQTQDWDLKIEGVDGNYAEWKQLRLEEATEITLVIKLSPKLVVVAEIE